MITLWISPIQFLWEERGSEEPSSVAVVSTLESFFNWRKIALQCCICFCHTTMRISHNYIYTPSLLSLLPLLPRSHSYRFSQSTSLGSLCYTAASHSLSVLHMIVYVCQCHFLKSPHPFLPPLCPEVHSLYVCVSIPSLFL